MDVSVVIINYNTCQMTQECIDSVFEKTSGITFEVILMDNASKDGSKEHFEKDSRIKYIYSYENLGFGRANNVGMMAAKGDYIFLLNSDTLLVNNAIKMLYDYASTHNHLAFYGGWLYSREMFHTTSYGHFKTLKSSLHDFVAPYVKWLPGMKSWRIKNNAEFWEKAFNNAGEAKEVDYVTGADMFFHRDVIEKTGWFDHRFFMYAEEMDWQRRAAGHGVARIIVKGPQIQHLQGSANKPGQKPKVNRLLWQGNRIYMRKWYGGTCYFLYRIMGFLLEAPVMLLIPIYPLKDRIKYIGWMLK